MNWALIRAVIVSVIMLMAVTACGGGGGGTGTAPATSTSAVSTGVMVKGSVIVNGVRFEDTVANISIDDTPKTAANLKDGMVVQVVGTVSADGVNGTAQQIEVQIEARGLVSSVSPAANPQRFVVLGQTVIVDDLTLYSNLAGFGAIAAGTTVVEVHGLRDATGAIRASRVEGSLSSLPDGTGMANPLVDEIRGVVSNLSGSVFNIGSQVVNAAGAAIAPSGASFGNGSVVEVHCTARPSCVVNGEFLASRVEVEDAEDAAFQPGQNQRFEAEGLVSGFSGPGDTAFFVAGVPVTISGSTRYVGGIATDLRDNIKVEAEGAWNGTSLAATKIEFKRSVVRLQGTVTASGASAFTLNITTGRSVNIETDSFTSGSVPPVGPNCVQVRGQRKAGGAVVVTAGEISTGCSNSDRPVIQATVEAESPETTVTLLGFLLDVNSPTDTPQWVDVNDQGISRTTFFNAVVPANLGPPAVAGTLVKVIFDETSNVVRQVELED